MLKDKIWHLTIKIKWISLKKEEKVILIKSKTRDEISISRWEIFIGWLVNVIIYLFISIKRCYRSLLSALLSWSLLFTQFSVWLFCSTPQVLTESLTGPGQLSQLGWAGLGKLLMAASPHLYLLSPAQSPDTATVTATAGYQPRKARVHCPLSPLPQSPHRNCWEVFPMIGRRLPLSLSVSTLNIFSVGPFRIWLELQNPFFLYVLKALKSKSQWVYSRNLFA